MPRYYTVQTNNPFDALNVDSDDDQILAMSPTYKAEEAQKEARLEAETKERNRAGRTATQRTGGGAQNVGQNGRGGAQNGRGGGAQNGRGGGAQSAGRGGAQSAGRGGAQSAGRGGGRGVRGERGGRRGGFAGERGGYTGDLSQGDASPESTVGGEYYLTHDNRGGQRGRARRGTRGYNTPANKRTFDRRGGVVKVKEATDPNTQLSDEVEAARVESDNQEVSDIYAGEPEEPKEPKLIDMETYLRENDMSEYMPESVEATISFNTDPTKGPLDIFTFCDRAPTSLKRGQANPRGGDRNVHGGDRNGYGGDRDKGGRGDRRGRGGYDKEREGRNNRKDSPVDDKSPGSHSSKSPKKLYKDTDLFPALA